MIPSSENRERIVRLKKGHLEAAEHVGVSAYMILAHVSDGIRNNDLDERSSGETYMSPQLSMRNTDADVITKGKRPKKDYSLK